MKQERKGPRAGRFYRKARDKSTIVGG